MTPRQVLVRRSVFVAPVLDLFFSQKIRKNLVLRAEFVIRVTPLVKMGGPAWKTPAPADPPIVSFISSRFL
jgi:hypothetical protein